MIDYFALALGHGLLALALLRLALREDVDSDPLITSLAAEAAARRKNGAKGSRARAAKPGDDAAAATQPPPPAPGSAGG
jgi:hypothetical protein